MSRPHTSLPDNHHIAGPPPEGRAMTPAFTTRPSDYLQYLGTVTVTTPDEELIADFLAGDYYAFNDLVAKHFRRVWFIARRYTDNIEDANDVLQDGLLKAFHKIHQFKGNSSFGTWLHRLIQNNAYDHYNKRKHHQDTVTINGDEPNLEIERVLSHDPTDDIDLSITMRDALDKLTPEHRNAIILVDFLGYDVDMAAGALGVKKGTIKSRRARAREHLRKHLEPLDAPPA